MDDPQKNITAKGYHA